MLKISQNVQNFEFLEIFFFRKKAWYLRKIANFANILKEGISNCNIAQKNLKTFKNGSFLEKKDRMFKKNRARFQKNGKFHLECVPKVLLLLKNSHNFQIFAFFGKIDGYLEKRAFWKLSKLLNFASFFSNASRNSLSLMCSEDIQNVGFSGRRDVFFCKNTWSCSKMLDMDTFLKMRFKK